MQLLDLEQVDCYLTGTVDFLKARIFQAAETE
jgi:hypothetical protein